MSGELSIRPGGPTEPVPVVQQTGEHNVNINNIGGNITILQPVIDNMEALMAVQSFSKEYYQLLVTCEEDVFVNKVISVSKERALIASIVPPEIFSRCSSLSEEGIEELKRIPAIICRENTGYNSNTDPRQQAMYGYIKKVRRAGKYIQVAFAPIAIFPQHLMCTKRNAVFFDLDMDCTLTDLNWSAWSVHKTNLFEAFDEAGITGMPRPK